MRALVVSDVHSSITALDAVLRDAETRGPVDAVWCAGDVVGYGPDPGDVIRALQKADAVVVAGNHDLAAIGAMGVEDFNPVAAEAALWTRDHLSAYERHYLGMRPKVVRPHRDVTIVHGSLRQPEWEYLLSAEQAQAQFALQPTLCSIVGHSHLAFWFEERGGAPSFHAAGDGHTVELASTRLILNPGSVGQPRDGDPRASYLIYDDTGATATWHRVAYDVAAVQARINDAGLPPFLASRLAVGR
jgi:predicted phosphodiesterase